MHSHTYGITQLTVWQRPMVVYNGMIQFNTIEVGLARTNAIMGIANGITWVYCIGVQDHNRQDSCLDAIK